MGKSKKRKMNHDYKNEVQSEGQECALTVLAQDMQHINDYSTTTLQPISYDNFAYFTVGTPLPGQALAQHSQAQPVHANQMFMNQMVLIPQPWAQNQMSHNQMAVMPQVDQQMEVRTVIQGERYTDLIKIVWQREFNRLFAQLPQDGVISKWNFFEVQNEVDPFQLQLRDWAKVRFECIKCGNGWTSMRGLIRFQIQIQNLFMPDRVCNMGNIFAQMFGQKCQRCIDERFENPMWYPEEVTKVLENLYTRVRHHFYGDIDLIQNIRIERRAGKPRNPHRPELCQACANGNCRMK